MSTQYTCEICGKEEHLRFVCSYCGGSFCSEHHLPENHNCINKPRTPPSYIRVKRGVYASKEVLHELERFKEREELENREKYAKVRAINRKKKTIRRARNFALLGLVFIIGFFVMIVYYAPPSITIISPETKTYNSSTIDITYTINKPALLMSYSLDGQVSIMISGNTTLMGLSEGLHNLTIYTSNILTTMSSDTVYFTVDTVPPLVLITSPKEEHETVTTACSIPLICLIRGLHVWVGYSLDGAENITLIGNITLTIPVGQHTLAVYANDTVGNMGHRKVSFRVTRVFGSINELISFLIKDDLSDDEWTSNYTCVEFAEEFIQRVKATGYYHFARYDLFDDEMNKFVSTVNSIEFVKTYSWGTTTLRYMIFNIPGVGHAVVKTTVNGVDIIVDPQTDIILTYPDFQVLYEGEITQD